jgi:NADPH-dependent ferric siderophore reductase
MFGGRLTGSYFLDLEVIGVDEIAEHVRLVKVASSDLVGFKYEPGQDLLFEFPDGDWTLRRRYTIRRSDPEKGTADVEFEMHRGSGPATRWVAKAQAGQRLEAIGPRGAVKVRSEAATHLFVVDDAAMPAAFSMLDAFPANMSHRSSRDGSWRALDLRGSQNRAKVQTLTVHRAAARVGPVGSQDAIGQ